MKFDDVRDALSHVISHNPHQAVMLWGLPGVGKSDLIRALAGKWEVPVIDMRLSQMDPPDLRGIPVPENGVTRFLPPAELPSEGEGILFLDEANAAPRATMAAAMQLVLDRQLGSYRVPQGWIIIAAGNRTTDGAVANAMPSALVNRFVHLTMDPDLDSTVAYALEHGWPMQLVRFLQWRPEMLHAMPKTRKDDEPFPSPRAWDFLAKTRALEAPMQLRSHLVRGHVGQGAAAELLAFCDLWQCLPTKDQILVSPDTAPVPDKPAAKFAITGSVMEYLDEHTIGPILRYLHRLGGAEWEAKVMMDVAKTPKLFKARNTPEAISWMQQNSHLFTGV